MAGRNVTRLREGLYLECRRVLLRWSAPLAELLVSGSPLVEGSSLCLKWPNACILDGLPIACVSTEAYSPGLHRVTCQPRSYTTGDLEPELEHLSRVLGPPAERWHGETGCVWQLGEVRVELRIFDPSEFQYTELFHKWMYIEYDVSLVKREQPLPPFPYEASTGAISLPAAIEGQLHRLVVTGHQAEAANIVNKLTEARLRAGPKVVEDYLDGLAAESISLDDAGTTGIQLAPDIENELRHLASIGKKVEAIKRVTALAGVGLREAKDYVDSLAEQ